MARILVVDDEQRNVHLLRLTLEGQGHAVEGVGDGAAALAAFREQAFDLVITDLRMEPVDGMAVIEGVQAEAPGTPVIVLTAYGEIETAVAAMRRGAGDYLTKPWQPDQLALSIARVLGDASLQRENRALRREVAVLAGGGELVGGSAPMAALRELIAKVAPTEATVLVRGESGTGKELVARAVHAASSRGHRPFVAVNCAAIPETLLESELFGYRKGAFTGADADREGLFEAAGGGTLFLDEIGEAGPGVQSKLLRVLEERRINRVGDPREREVDVRVVAATNRPLEAAIAAGGFREDLYYRLNVFPLDVPPLRERLDDLPDLAARFLGSADALPAAALRRMRAYGWPGNVRELRNVLERARILAGHAPLADGHLLLDARTAAAADEDPGGELNLEAGERRLIRAALKRAGGNKTLAAELLGITRRTLYSRLKLLGMGDAVAGRGE